MREAPFQIGPILLLKDQSIRAPARLKIQSKKTQKFSMVKFQLEEQTPNLISELNIEEEE